MGPIIFSIFINDIPGNKSNDNVLYFMNEKAIPMDDSIKDLGVIYNKDMKFHDHICKITSSARSRLAVI